jgi:hypothetical protein
MFFRKNLPDTERGIRFAIAGAMILCGLYLFGFTAVGYAIAGAGVFTALTAFFGFCPACAMIGRKPVAPN